MTKMLRTKIICTIGPGSSDPAVLGKMMDEGLDFIRINFSHRAHPELKKWIETIRKLNQIHSHPALILGDLAGFRIRVGYLKNGLIELKKGSIGWLTTERRVGDENTIPFDYTGSLSRLEEGYDIYIDDGNITLKVTEVEDTRVGFKVIRGGRLVERKGVNIPQADLEFASLTEKDEKDIQFIIENRLDYIAQSFVRDKQDVLRIQDLVKEALPECKIVAKIENRTALKNIEEIIRVSDGIMIARGDLGISIPIYEVPIVQKELIKKCKAKQRFVITATQMLESMTEHSLPTRAEASDVTNAVLDGTNAVMLSGETAVGKYPVETVRMMNQIVAFAESSTFYKTEVSS